MLEWESVLQKSPPWITEQHYKRLTAGWYTTWWQLWAAKIRTKQKKKPKSKHLSWKNTSEHSRWGGGIHYHHSKKTSTDLLWEKDHLVSMIQKENQIKTQFLAWQDLEGSLGSSRTLLPLAPKIYHHFSTWKTVPFTQQNIFCVCSILFISLLFY